MVEKQSSSLFGKLLTGVHTARTRAYKQAEADLWKRNKIKNKDGYRIAETKQLLQDGTEVKEFRLYKLIDTTTVTISSQVDVKVEHGS